MDKDEIEVSVEDTPEIEIKVVDDTPPEDRNRKPIDKSVAEVDDEATEYGKKVRKRLDELRRLAHDERREKEAVMRERDEAINFAKRVASETGILKQKLTYGEASFADEAEKKAETALELANKKFKDAYESGDSNALAAANIEIAEAMMAKKQAETWKNRARIQVEALQNDKSDVYIPPQPHQQQNRPPRDPRADDWVGENSDWFGKDPVMTSTAYGIHEKLIKQGVHPVEDADDYYEAIDSEMRKRFPDFDWNSNESLDFDSDRKQRAVTQPARKTTPPVSRVSRPSGSGANRVVLTKTQVALAERLGLTPQQYAQQLIKERG